MWPPEIHTLASNADEDEFPYETLTVTDDHHRDELNKIMNGPDDRDYESTKKNWTRICQIYSQHSPMSLDDTTAVNVERGLNLDAETWKTDYRPPIFLAAARDADKAGFVKELEESAFTNMKLLLESTRLKTAWVLTVFGRFFRLWACTKDSPNKLLPVLPVNKPHNTCETYLEFKGLNASDVETMISFISFLGPPTSEHVKHAAKGIARWEAWVDTEHATQVKIEEMLEDGQLSCHIEDSVVILPSSGWFPAFVVASDEPRTRKVCYHLPKTDYSRWYWTWELLPNMNTGIN